MKRLEVALVLGVGLLAPGCRLFDRDEVVTYPAAPYSVPYYCQPCPPGCVPAPVQCTPCTPAAPRPVLGR